MQPVGSSDAAHAGLIGMEDGSLAECVADFIDGRSDPIRTARHGLHDAARTRAVAEKVLAKLRDPPARDHLSHIEIGHGGLHAGTVLHRRGDSAGKSGTRERAAVGTNLALRQIFGDEQLDVGAFAGLKGLPGLAGVACVQYSSGASSWSGSIRRWMVACCCWSCFC